MRYTIKRITTATTFFVVAVIFFGCTNGPKQIGPRKASEWAYAPASILVHPLSRFNNSNESSTLQTIVVHIKLLDGDGFACRGMGVITVSIEDQTGDPVFSDAIDLTDPETNRTFFDEVTRTYRVQFDEVPIQYNRVVVKATFIVSGEQPLRSSSYSLISSELTR